MKKIKWLTIAPLVAVGIIPTVTACSNTKTYDIKDYVIDLEWKDTSKNFNILQLTDIHIANTTDKPVQYKFLQEIIDKAKAKCEIDLIVITGDMFDFASKADANEFIDFFEKQKINWTCIFGNHDEQNYFPLEWLTGRLNEITEKGGYCKFKNLQNDDVYGNCNFVINLKHDNANIEQLVMIDSNTYRFYPKFGYDYIHDDQIKWYDRVVEEFNMNKSLAFFHIPFEEFETFYQKAKNGEDGIEFIKDKDGNVRNKYLENSIPKIHTDLYDHFIGKKGIEGSHTQGVFIGHNHYNSYCVENKNDKIKLCFGIKSSNKVECDEELGGQIISLKNDEEGTFELDTILNKY